MDWHWVKKGWEFKKYNGWLVTLSSTFVDYPLEQSNLEFPAKSTHLLANKSLKSPGCCATDIDREPRQAMACSPVLDMLKCEKENKEGFLMLIPAIGWSLALFRSFLFDPQPFLCSLDVLLHPLVFCFLTNNSFFTSISLICLSFLEGHSSPPLIHTDQRHQ